MADSRFQRQRPQRERRLGFTQGKAPQRSTRKRYQWNSAQRQWPSVAGKDEALPVKTVPTHFSRVYRASEDDVARIFGREDKAGSDWFNVGSPIDMETPVCLNLPKFVERSNGIFGKSGTGKTFLTRTVLCGLIHHQPDVVNLIFDSHNEYGWEARSEGGAPVKGLCQIFGKNKVKIYSLDAESSRARNVGHVEEVKIPLNEIMPDDLLSMQRELNLADAAAESAYLVRNRFGKDWLLKLLDLNKDEDLGQRSGADTGAASRRDTKAAFRPCSAS
jgi:DNA helicase HerA-like ATPase